MEKIEQEKVSVFSIRFDIPNNIKEQLKDYIFEDDEVLTKGMDMYLDQMDEDLEVWERKGNYAVVENGYKIALYAEK